MPTKSHLLIACSTAGKWLSKLDLTTSMITFYLHFQSYFPSQLTHLFRCCWLVKKNSAFLNIRPNGDWTFRPMTLSVYINFGLHKILIMSLHEPEGEPPHPKQIRTLLRQSIVTFAGPDSSNGRASASGAGGRRFETRPRHTEGVKNGISGYLAWCSAL